MRHRQSSKGLGNISRRQWLRGAIALTTLTTVQVVRQSALAAADLQAIQKRGRLVVAVKDNLRPLGFRNDAGELVGLEIDLAHRLAQEILGNSQSVELIPVLNVDRLSAVTSGKADVAIARLTVTRSRERQVVFSTPYYLDGTTIITANSAVQTLADLRRQAIAVLNGSNAVAILQSRFPRASLVPVASYQEAQQLLELDDATAFAADASVLTGWVQDDPNYRLLRGFLSTEALAIAMPKGIQHSALYDAVNGAIARWQASGWLDERIQTWGLPRSSEFYELPRGGTHD